MDNRQYLMAVRNSARNVKRLDGENLLTNQSTNKQQQQQQKTATTMRLYEIVQSRLHRTHHLRVG